MFSIELDVEFWIEFIEIQLFIEDFDKGITYVDIMKNNVEVLKEALN